MSLNFLITLLITLISIPCAHAGESPADYASDDAHNHDGTHIDGPENCGTDFMLPGSTVRLGSHSFIILGLDGENHILADHRSGTPPHNYQFILRIRLDPNELELYKKLKKESKQIPAFTTIYFDDTNPKKKLDRTFFCLPDLPYIFGAKKKKGDQFEKLFPIRASLQKDADFEGAFEIGRSIYPGGHLTLEREDVELVLYRYLPSYLDQSALRKAINQRRSELVPLLSLSPLFASEPIDAARGHKGYSSNDGAISEVGVSCPRDYYLKNAPVPKTIHTFVLLAEVGTNTVLAVHYYDSAPHNFQTVLHISLSDEEMKLYRMARDESKSLPILQSRWFSQDGKAENSYFCMAEIRKLIAQGNFSIKATIFKNSTLDEFKVGSPVGTVDLTASEIRVITNRNLLSLMNPILVAKDVLGDNFESIQKRVPSK